MVLRSATTIRRVPADRDNPFALAARAGRELLLFAALAEEFELGSRPSGDAWQAHLVERLLADENPFSSKCEMAGPDGPGADTVAAARCDLAALRRLYELDADRVRTALGDDLPSWAGFRALAEPTHAAA